MLPTRAFLWPYALKMQPTACGIAVPVLPVLLVRRSWVNTPEQAAAQVELLTRDADAPEEASGESVAPPPPSRQAACRLCGCTQHQAVCRLCGCTHSPGQAAAPRHGASPCCAARCILCIVCLPPFPPRTSIHLSLQLAHSITHSHSITPTHLPTHQAGGPDAGSRGSSRSSKRVLLGSRCERPGQQAGRHEGLGRGWGQGARRGRSRRGCTLSCLMRYRGSSTATVALTVLS